MDADYKLHGYMRNQMETDLNLHSPQRRLIELRMAHADLDGLIDLAAGQPLVDDLAVRRFKKRRLLLRDQIVRLELQIDPPEPA